MLPSGCRRRSETGSRPDSELDVDSGDHCENSRRRCRHRAARGTRLFEVSVCAGRPEAALTTRSRPVTAEIACGSQGSRPQPGRKCSGFGSEHHQTAYRILVISKLRDALGNDGFRPCAADSACAAAMAGRDSVRSACWGCGEIAPPGKFLSAGRQLMPTVDRWVVHRLPAPRAQASVGENRAFCHQPFGHRCGMTFLQL